MCTVCLSFCNSVIFACLSPCLPLHASQLACFDGCMLLACLLACLLVCCLLACLPVCLLACLPACLLACLPDFLLVCLLASKSRIRRRSSNEAFWAAIRGGKSSKKAAGSVIGSILSSNGALELAVMGVISSKKVFESAIGSLISSKKALESPSRGGPSSKNGPIRWQPLAPS